MIPVIGAWLAQKGASALVKPLAIAGVVAVVGVAGWLAYRYVDGLTQQVATLTANNAKLDIMRQEAEARGDALRRHIEDVAAKVEHNNAMLGQVAADAAQARADAKATANMFAKHNLGRLLNAKPELLERRINAGTARVQRLLEQASTPGGQAGAGSATGSSEAGHPPVAGPR